MQKGLTTLGLAGAALAFSAAPASAQLEFFSYLGAYGGANWTADGDVRIDNDERTSGRGSFDSGFVAGGTLGLAAPVVGPAVEDAPIGIRPEIDVSFRKNNVDVMPRELADVGTGQTGDVSGDIRAWSALVNLWIDLHLLRDIAPLPGALGAVTPYVGGGLGASRVKMNNLNIEGEQVADDRDTVLAYQLGAGTSFQFLENLHFSIDYRFFVADRPQFSNQTDGSFSTEYQNHSIMGGVRFAF